VTRPEDIDAEFNRLNEQISDLIAERDEINRAWHQQYVTESQARMGAEAERDRLAGWLKVVAQAQHQLLDQVKLNLTDEEWGPFAEALGLSTQGDDE
jgi:DNA replication initiation complex subunit (GINS family)